MIMHIFLDLNFLRKSMFDVDYAYLQVWTSSCDRTEEEGGEKQQGRWKNMKMIWFSWKQKNTEKENNRHTFDNKNCIVMLSSCCSDLQ